MSAPDVEPPLFYQPGKAGFYSLVQATPTPERLQAFRGVGRMIGLGLLLAEVFPLPLCRHVLKFIMMKEVRSGQTESEGESEREDLRQRYEAVFYSTCSSGNDIE